MSRVRISGWVAAAGLLLAACSESRVAPENEACLGAGGGAASRDYVALGMPDDEPDLQAWVAAEQHGLLGVTTRPCDPRPRTRMLAVVPEARVVFADDGREGSFSDIRPGQKLSVWFHGGASGKTRSVVVERAEPWPPGSGGEPRAATAAEGTPAPGADGAATTASPAP